MARPVVVSVVVALVGLLTACAEGITAEGYSAALNEARCGHLVACGALNSLDDCHRALPMFDIPLDENLAAALEAGNVTFNRANAKACVDGIATDSCDITHIFSRGSPDVCLQTYTGTVHDGKACAIDAECVSQHCDVPACGEVCCIGTCIGDRPPEPPKLGEPCTPSGACAAGLYCDGGSCAALLPAGATCQSLFACDDGLVCNMFGIGAATCVPLPTLGESCGLQCRDLGTTCEFANHVCVRAAIGGDACGSNMPCSQYYTCGTTSRCSLVTHREVMLGEACGRDDVCVGERMACASLPDRPTSTCVQFLLDGEACGPDVPDRFCWSGVCDPETHTCIRGQVCI